MRKNTETLKPVQNVSKLLLICSTLLLVSCQGAPVFPTKTLWEVDTDFGVCGEYEITDLKNYKYRHVKDWPIEKCNGVFGFSAEDRPKVISWLKAIKKHFEQVCNQVKSFLD